MSADAAFAHGQNESSLFETVPLGGLAIAVSQPRDAAARICSVASNIPEGKGVGIHLVNAYTVALASRDKQYSSVLAHSSANLPDGKPLSWISNINGRRLWQVRGPSLFGQVMDLGRDLGIKHFLLGATDETLEKLNYELKRRYPGIQIVGQFSPPFREVTQLEIAAQDEIICESKAQIVWVGLGTPKQDFEVRRLANSLSVVAIAVGAAFDFVAGTKNEAPTWMSKIGIEWLFRLMSEPRRLWRRYLFGNIEFLWAVLTKAKKL